MNPDLDPGRSARRIASRAALLLLPTVVIAVVAPNLVRTLRGARAERAAIREGAPDPRGVLPVQAVPPEPRPPEGPTPGQIEAARDAQVALGRAEKGWESVSVLSPREGKVGQDGLETLPFEGFGVSVDSAPVGARVRVNGEEVGETPLLAGVVCTPGSEVKVRVEGARAARERILRCRADTLVKLSVRLGDGASPAASGK